MDPWGYLDGKDLVEDRKSLVAQGDYIATFMAWLKDVPAGGGTGFIGHDYEDVIKPERGAAALWFDLTNGNDRDDRSIHSGCPITAGSKWILNKCEFNAFFYSFELKNRCTI